MQHTRKLVLVDPQFVKPSIKDNVLSNLDVQIHTILNDKEDGDDVKAKKYMDVLQRYKLYDIDSKPAVKNIENLEDKVLKSTPHNLQYKAKQILTQLQKDGDVDFTEEGQLVYKQVPIDDSNIVNLIADVLQKKPSTIPGTKELAASLKSTKTATELVANPTIAKLIAPSKAKKQEIIEEKPTSATKRKRTKKIHWEEY